MIPIINLPCIPLAIFIVIAVIFVLFLLFTNYRYSFNSENYVENVTTLSTLVLAFIILYAIQKFDDGDTDVNLFAEKICYLNSVAQKVDPSLTPLLIKYAEAFYCQRTSFAIYKFQDKINKKIKDADKREQIKSVIYDTVKAFDGRINGQNVINNWIWYLVIIVSIIFSLLFGLDIRNSISDGLFVLALTWIPVIIVYYLYLQKETFVRERTCCILRKLYASAGKDPCSIKISCPKEKCCVRINV